MAYGLARAGRAEQQRVGAAGGATEGHGHGAVLAILPHDGDAALLAEGWIGEYQVVLPVLAGEGVARLDG